MYFKEFGGISVFPLEKISTSFGSYYIDSSGQVYSTKRGSLQKLQGNRDSFNDRIYSLSTGRFPVRMRMTGKVLITSARNHKHWFIETGTEGGRGTLGVIEMKNTKGTKTIDPRHHAGTVEDGIKRKGWVIGRVHKGSLVFGSEPKIHTAVSSVESEMIRLASSQPRNEVRFDADHEVCRFWRRRLGMIYVDLSIFKKGSRGKKSYCHMAADSLDELHAFAERIGVRRHFFHRHDTMPHYDLNEGQREAAVQEGAQEISPREMVVKTKAMIVVQAQHVGVE